MQEIWNRYVRRPRGRFESTADYVKKVTPIVPEALILAIEIPRSRDPLSRCGLDLDYDADKEEYTAATALEDIATWCTVKRVGTYLGENGFGVKRRITRYDVVRYGVVMRSGSDESVELDTMRAQVSRARAKELDPHLRLVMWFRPTADSSGVVSRTTTTASAPTINAPVDELVTSHHVVVDRLWLGIVDTRSRAVVMTTRLMGPDDPPFLPSVADDQASLDAHANAAASGIGDSIRATRATKEAPVYAALELDSAAAMEGEVGITTRLRSVGRVEVFGMWCISPKNVRTCLVVLANPGPEPVKFSIKGLSHGPVNSQVPLGRVLWHGQELRVAPHTDGHVGTLEAASRSILAIPIWDDRWTGGPVTIRLLIEGSPAADVVAIDRLR